MYVFGLLGVEAGGLYRTTPDLANTGGLQLGAFATLGYVSVELRAGLAPSTRMGGVHRYGSDLGVAFAVKLPVQFSGGATGVKRSNLVPCIWRWQ